MPQMNLFEQDELHVVRVVLIAGDAVQPTRAVLMAENRAGAMLASAGLIVTSDASAELLPAMLSLVGYGFLYRGPHEAVVGPGEWFRTERKRLDKRL